MTQRLVQFIRLPLKQGLYLRSKGVVFAMALSMLPVLTVGSISFYVGNRAILEQAHQVQRVGVLGPVEAEFLRERQLRLLGLMLLGTGITALSAGAIAAGVTDRFLQVVKRKGRLDRTTELNAEPSDIEQDEDLQDFAPYSDRQSTGESTAPVSEQSVVLTGGLRRILAIAGSARALADNIEHAHIQLPSSREAPDEPLPSDLHNENDLSEIQDTFAGVTQTAKHINERTHRISEIVSSIDELATQVNQVSINALIQSGREQAADLKSSLLTTETVRSLTQDIVQKTTEVAPVVSNIKADVTAVEAGIEFGTEKIAARVELPLETWGRLR